MANTKKIPDTIKKEAPKNNEIDNFDSNLENDITDKVITKVPKNKSVKSSKPVTTRMIRATSKVSTELDQVWYSFEYSETREVHDDEDIEAARLDLWNTVHTEVDTQVSYTIESIRGTNDSQPNAAGIPQNYGIPPEYDY